MEKWSPPEAAFIVNLIAVVVFGPTRNHTFKSTYGPQFLFKLHINLFHVFKFLVKRKSGKMHNGVCILARRNLVLDALAGSDFGIISLRANFSQKEDNDSSDPVSSKYPNPKPIYTN